MGLIGAGFAGAHHVDAVRRLGFVNVVAVAGSSQSSADQKARQLGIPRAYGDYRSLLDDQAVQVVHNATPNHLHYAVTSAALAHRKHVVSEKPLAMTAAEADALLEQAERAGVVHAVTFNYRGNALVQQMRSAVVAGEIGAPHLVVGQYLQDWLLEDTDYSWRLDPSLGGASCAFADIGSHWCDLAEHVTGARMTQVLGTMSTVVRQRRVPSRSREAFATDHETSGKLVDVTTDDLASVLMRFDNGATGSLTVGQVCAGHKNDLSIEVCGATASLAWRQERQNELWVGHRHTANERLARDPSLIDQSIRRYAPLPGGHQEGWADAFHNVMRDIYTTISANHGMAERPPAFASFADGCRAQHIVEAVLASARANGIWITL